MPLTKKTNLSATKSQTGNRRQQKPERAGHKRSSRAAEHVAQPPMEIPMVASHSPQPPTAPIMVAPSVIVPGSTDTIGSSLQESAEMTQDGT